MESPNQVYFSLSCPYLLLFLFLILYIGYSSGVWTFDLNSGLWTVFTDEPQPTTYYGFAYVVAGTNLFLFGGFDNNGEIQSSMWSYDLSAPSWELSEPTDVAVVYANAWYSEAEGYIYLYGGFIDKGLTGNVLHAIVRV